MLAFTLLVCSAALQGRSVSPELVTVGPAGEPSIEEFALEELATPPTLSADGRFVAFESRASNLVAADSNGLHDVFVRDLWSGVTERASVGSAGQQGDGESTHPELSADGRFVVFQSNANNFALGDAWGDDVFVRDRWLGTTELVSTDSAGAPGDDSSQRPSISADGRFVAFDSDASNLVLADTNFSTEVFVHDRVAKTTTRVSVTTAGLEPHGRSWSPEISADGRFVVFLSRAFDMAAGHTSPYVRVFVHDLTSGKTELASVAAHGYSPNGDCGVEPSYSETLYGGPAISGDGRFVAYSSIADDILRNVHGGLFVRDRTTGATKLVSQPAWSKASPNAAFGLAFSTDGSRLAFASNARNLTPGKQACWTMSIYVTDMRTGGFASLPTGFGDWHEGNDSSFAPSLSADGSTVVFWSAASDLVASDPNGRPDVFVATPRFAMADTYCAPSTASNSGRPWLGAVGESNAGPGGTFLLVVQDALPGSDGLLLYGLSGAAYQPFGHATLCVAPPFRRLPMLTLTKQPGECVQSTVIDFDAWIESDRDPALVAGQRVWAQSWCSDRGFASPNDFDLTNALTFELAP